MCGLAGIISTEKTNFNINHFNVLGALNDERGGDSCGVFIDGDVQYGIKESALFRNFTCDMNYPKSASIALLHCRKTSVGYSTNLSQAQPIIIKNKGKIDFVLMHNGTVTNASSLAYKYLPKLDIFGLSDSQIMAHIMYNCGYEVLNEYTGCAVFIIVDYRGNQPQVLIFKGDSCYNEGKNKSERPLFYMVKDNKFHFSSMYESLYCIDCKKTIYYIPVNKLLTVKDNTLFIVAHYDRTKLKKPNYGYVSRTYTNDINMLYYNDATGAYMINDSVAHGGFCVYASGYTIDPKYQKDTDNPLWFFRGRLLFNEDCFKFLESIDELFEDTVLSTLVPEAIDYFSYTPRLLKHEWYTVNENFEYIPYTNGEWVTLFNSPNKYTIIERVETKAYIYPMDAINEFRRDSQPAFFDFESLETQILNLITNKLVNVDAV